MHVRDDIEALKAGHNCRTGLSDPRLFSLRAGSLPIYSPGRYPRSKYAFSHEICTPWPLNGLQNLAGMICMAKLKVGRRSAPSFGGSFKFTSTSRRTQPYF